MIYQQRTVNNIDTKISQHTKDIIQKYTSSLFKNATLEFYGIKTARIKELINVELPVIEVSDSSTDFIFLLEDNSYLHFEFQTTYNKDDIERFAMYDLRLYVRDGRSITTVIIYSADVKKANTNLNIGSLLYSPDKIMMYDYNGNAIFEELENKIKSGHDINDIDMLNLILLPLMRNTIPKEDLAVKSIKLAQTIPDKTKRNTCIASVIAFANRYLSENKLNELLEVLKMTDLATMLIEEREIEIAKKALRKGSSIDFVKDITGLSIDTIQELQEELDNE